MKKSLPILVGILFMADRLHALYVGRKIAAVVIQKVKTDSAGNEVTWATQKKIAIKPN